MGNLIPTPRVDKHGRTVIRHMRAIQKGGTTSLPSPPTPAPVDDFNEMKLEMLSRIKSTFHLRHYEVCRVSVDDITEHYQTMGEDVLRAYLPYVMSTPRNDGHTALLISVLNNKLSDAEAGNVLFVARNLESADRGDWNTVSGGSEDYDRTMSFLNGFSQYPFPEPNDLLSASHEEQERTLALLAVYRAVNDTDRRFGISYLLSARSGRFLSDPELVALAAERASDANEIASIIRERKTTNVEAIREILDSPSKSLREGIL